MLLTDTQSYLICGRVHERAEPIGKKRGQYLLLSGVPDYFDRNKISSGGDLSHYSSASLY